MQGVENVSTLMDGELDIDAAGREIARLKMDTSSRVSWDTYHLIGDALRGAAAGAPTFGLRFSDRLAQEPTVLAPQPSVLGAAPVARPFARKFRTYALSAAASVAAVAVVGWVALNTVNPFKPDAPASGLAAAPVAQPQAVAQAVVAPPSAPLAVAPQAVAAAATVEPVQEYLLAHQGISPTTAFQGVTPYIRTVSSTGE